MNMYMSETDIESVAHTHIPRVVKSLCMRVIELFEVEM